MAPAKPLFVRYVAKDFLDGTQTLMPMEELAYRRICDLLYVHAGNVPDDDSLAWATKTGEQWPAIRDALLAKRKIKVVRGKVVVQRCKTELDRAKRLQKSVENASKVAAKARKTTAKKPKITNARKANRNNDIPPDGTSIGTPNGPPSGTPTGQPCARVSQIRDSSSSSRESALSSARLHETQDRVLRLLEDFDGSWATRDAGAVRQWLADGADPDTHIIPVIEEKIASGQVTGVKTMKWFTPAIIDRMAKVPIANGADDAPDNARFVNKTVERALARGDNDDARAIIDAKKAGGWDAAETAAQAYLDDQAGRA